MMRASTLPRKLIAALAVGPQISGLATMFNLRYPMFGGSRSAFLEPAVDALQLPPHRSQVRASGRRALGQHGGAEIHAQVFVVADLTEIGSKLLGKGIAIGDRIV